MRAALALIFTGAFSIARADSWVPAAASGIASPDGQVVVRVLPGDDFDEVFGFSGAKKGKPATAIFFRLVREERYVKYQETQLVNPIAPVYYAVSNDGELITLDNWHNVGVGKIIAVYGAKAELRRSYSLSEIYTEEEIRKMERSTSSIWWRCSSSPVLDSRSPVLELNDALGNVLEINLRTGALSRTGTHKGC